ncbi:S41 family peptidase [Candidatus Peregrinibacteria bacterium]|nr:S41 family peptidase [Candidatus Peregrinibacteria bacterium]
MYRILSRLSVIFLTLIFPVGVFAAPRPVDLLKVDNDEIVTRGDFIRAAVNILGLSIKEGGELPYPRIPRGLIPYISTAYNKGALDHLGDDLRLGQGITRGDALLLLVRLMNLEPELSPSRSFRDAPKGTLLGDAVQTAVEHEWMESFSGSLFGVRRILLGQEARLLLGRLGKEVTIPKKPERIQIRFSLPEQKELPKKDILQTIWDLLNKQFLYDDRIDPEEAAYRAAESIVQSMKDPYTTFMRPVSARNFQTQIDGEVSGIGAQVEYVNEILTIVSPLPGSPAQAAGLKPGDQIILVDGETVIGLGFLEGVEKVRGPKGSSVILRIRRNGADFDVTVIRDTVKVPEIKISWQGEVAVVQLIQFGRSVDNGFRSELIEIQKRKPKGIILDLRNNPGGLLHAAQSVLANFLPLGSTFAIIRTRGEEVRELTDTSPTIDRSIPMVVLVNGGSASASEIVAGALQDTKRARIVGEKTFGKGTVQQVIEFNDGSSIKMTIAEWFTPSERKIDGAGIKPDFALANTDNRDEQMLKALDLLR